MSESDSNEPSWNLGFEEAAAHFESPSQRARIWTEQWARSSLYCPNCGGRSLSQFPANRPVADFYCGPCGEEFELKSQRARFGAKIVDGAYRTMQERLAAQNNPSLFLLRYDVSSFGITDALVVPKQFFVVETIEARKPLAPTARRAGWIGCNILLSRIPDAGKIYLIRDGQPAPRQAVLERWQETLFLRRCPPQARGWLLDVLRVVEEIGRAQFNLEDVYAREDHLQALHPANRNVRPKIRQQLQVLRDSGVLEFVGRGLYRLKHRP